MARKEVNIGTTGNDATGDSIRVGFDKVNQNFVEIYAALGLGGGLNFQNLDNTPATITSNKILAICTVFGERNPGVDTKYYYVNLDRDSTRIVTNWGNAMNFRQTNQARTHASISYLDSPATTSEITYKMSGDFSIAATSATFFVYTKTITLMEVVA